MRMKVLIMLLADVGVVSHLQFKILNFNKIVSLSRYSNLNFKPGITMAEPL